jgi:hypothetical protein
MAKLMKAAMVTLAKANKAKNVWRLSLTPDINTDTSFSGRQV